MKMKGTVLLRRTVILLAGITAFIALFYAEENWRGKRAWENCNRELEAKGEILEWDKLMPPLVPDDQNFFMAPKMQEWFVKSRADNPPKNELIKHLSRTNTGNLVIAEVTLTPPPEKPVFAESSILVLRYVAFGKSVFLPPAMSETNMSSPDFLCPKLTFTDVPLATGIEHLARHAGLNYMFEPSTFQSLRDENGQPSTETEVSLKLENIPLRYALLAVLNASKLQWIEKPGTKVAVVAPKNPGAPTIYAPADAREKIQATLQQVLGKHSIAAQGFVLLKWPVADIKPAHIILQTEGRLDEKEIAGLFSEFLPTSKAGGAPIIKVRKSEPNSFQILLDAESAADYLAWTDRSKADFELIREALKRPYFWMDGDYSKPFENPIHNFVAVRVLAQTLAQRAQCDFMLGKPEVALRELALLDDSRRILEGAPTGRPMSMVAAMINVAVSGLLTGCIIDGIQSGKCQESQLAALQELLRQINLPPYLIEAFKSERASTCHFILAASPVDAQETAGCFGMLNAWNKPMNPVFLFCKVAPLGWRYQNMCVAAKLEQADRLCFSSDGQTILPRKVDESTQAINDARHLTPYNFLASVFVQNFCRAFQTLGRNQTLINQTQIACALERYRLAHSEYPETLEVLMPQFIQKLPHDVIGGKSLHYQRTAGGRFVLYSVGWNESDDGGVTVYKDDGTPDWEKGDWVWKN
jgi:hypothetical protein